MKYLNLNLLILLVALSLSFYLQAKEKQPNSLIILGDDISAHDMGCYGSPNPNTTPNIDKLAKEGLHFSNMFVSEAMCAPTRAELYTGNHNATVVLETTRQRMKEL